MSEVLVGIIVLVCIAVAYTIFTIGKSIGMSYRDQNAEREQNASYVREILARDRQIHELRNTIDELNKINDRYLSFLLKIPTVVQRLNATLKVDEIIASVVTLVTDIIPTKTMEFYLLDGNNNVLKEVSAMDEKRQAQTYAIGEGIVGMAAQHRMVQTREHFEKMHRGKNDDATSDTGLWIAVPVQFKDRLLGVIAIGPPTRTMGNEIDLMKMIADIAAVALINQTMIGEAKHKANTDALTGLNNRNYLFHMAQHYVEKAIREGTPISVFLFDIDHFKHYNDSNGHDEGDNLLKELSDVIRTSTRKNSVIVRYGGEEFIVLLPGISKEDALIYAERLREKIAEYPFRHRREQPLGCVSISGGVASFPLDGDSIYKVIQLADMALYRAKSEGRNRVVAHQPFSFSESSVEPVIP